MLLVIGRRFAGGVLALLVLVGAMVAHLTVLGISTPMSNALGAEKTPVLFMMALAFLAVAAFVTWMSRRALASPVG